MPFQYGLNFTPLLYVYIYMYIYVLYTINYFYYTIQIYMYQSIILRIIDYLDQVHFQIKQERINLSVISIQGFMSTPTACEN